MSRFVFSLLLLCSLSLGWSPLPCRACPDIIFGDPLATPLVLGAGRDACWAGSPNMEGTLISSERIDAFDLVSELADDFVITQATQITLARWWGGFWCSMPPFDDLVPVFILRFYTDDDCRPGTLLHEFFLPNDDCNETHVYTQQGGFWIYQYEAGVSVAVTEGQRYWFSAQAGDHVFQPQWGRLTAAEVANCQGAFKSRFFGYPDWIPLEDIMGWPEDVFAELECSLPTGIQRATWGAVRALYR